MSYSTRIRYVTGGGRDFDVPFPYLQTSDVKVLVRGVPAPFAWLTASRIRLANTPGVGDVLDIRRETDIHLAIVAFQDGATLTAEELNTALRQSLYAQQELVDLYEDSIVEAKVRLGENLGVVVPPESVIDTIIQLALESDLLDDLAGVIADINSLGVSILAHAARLASLEGNFDGVTADLAAVRATVDAILSGGAGLDEDALALITTIQTQQVDGDNAIASELHLVGAKNVAGTAFVLNLDTVKVSLSETLGERLTAISAELGANAAGILSESTTRATAIAALASTVTGVSAVANARNRTFSATTAPASGMVAGDLWFDSDDGNKAYRYNGTAWVATDDTRIAANTANITTETTARSDADTALASQITTVSAVTATRNRTFYQTTAPSAGLTAGDLWFDSDDGNKAYRWSGSVWVATDDTRIAANTALVSAEATARADADTALASSISTVTATAIAKNKTFAQTTAPASGMVAGDLWLDTDDTNKLYRYNGTTWVALDDARIATNAANITAEATARASGDSALSTTISSVSAVANARNRTYAQTTAPNTGMVTGDIWYDTANGNKSYRYSGSAWVAFDDTRLASNAAAITSEATARASADSALATTLSLVGASADAGTSFILNTSTVKVGVSETLASRLSSITTAAANNTSAIITEAATRTTADSALSTRIDAVESAVATAGNRSYRQDAPPTGVVAGDLWVETDNNNQMWRYNGTIWQAIDDTRLATNTAAITAEATTRASADTALSTSISTVSAVANARNRTYSQTAAPSSGMVSGDIWFDSDDNFKAYRYSGSAWVATDDSRIAANAAAITSEASTRASADTALSTSLSTISATVTGQTTSISANAAAITAEATARASADAALSTSVTTVTATANGRNRTFAQTTAPSGANSGDLWLDTSANNKMYRFNGSSWAAVDDTRIAANTASITTTAAATADIDSRLSATYGFQLDINGKVSGMKAQALGAGGAVVSTIDFNFDKFRIFNGTSTLAAFEVSGGNTYVAGNFVRTGSVENDAISLADTQIRTSGFGGAGPIALAYSGSLPYTKVDEYAFTYSGTGSVTIEWIGLLQWAANAGRQVNVMLTLDASPILVSGADTGVEVVMKYYGNANNSTATVILPKTFTGLSVGAHTVYVYARAVTNAANHPSVDINACTKMFMGKK